MTPPSGGGSVGLWSVLGSVGSLWGGGCSANDSSRQGMPEVKGFANSSPTPEGGNRLVMNADGFVGNC